MKSIVLTQQNIAVLDDKIRIEIPISALKDFFVGKKKVGVDKEAVKKTERHKAFKEARGAWKNHKIDPLEYQRKIREEWN